MRRLVPFFLLFSARFLAAATPYQVIDLKLTPGSVGSSEPLFGAAVNGRLIFSATTPTTGEEPWSTDGTAAGTVLLKDINPGRNDSYAGDFTTVGNLVYFDAYIGPNEQLWQTDGTPAGTRQSDITGYPLAALGSKLLTIDDANDLKITDGTVAGTTPLAALGRGTNADLLFIGPADDRSLYIASGFGLWRTDGTVAGTKLLNPVHVANAVKAGNSLIFIGSDAATGREPWISDGTAAGTHMIRELVAGSGSAFTPTRIPMAAAGNRAVFATLTGDVWATDGTASGTSLLLKSPVTTPAFVQMASFNGYVYFAGTDGNGQELWRTDGTVAGTSLFKDINPGPASSTPLEFGATSSRLFFYADDGTHGSELWSTDGSVAGTRLVRDINQGPRGSWSGYQISFASGDQIYFDASDSLHGSEPWVSDGTESGTHIIADLSPQTVGSSVPYFLVPAGDGLYFFAARTDDTELSTLWKTDGSASGTKRLFTFGGDESVEPVAIGNALFFVNGGALWKTDGTVSGTVQVNLADAPAVHSLLAIDNRLYVDGYAPFGYGTWVLDESGHEVLPLKGASDFVPFGGKVFYYSTNEFTPAIASMDGTASGTHTAWHVPSGLTATSPLYSADGSLFFFMSTHPGGSENDVQLWKSNGTAEGTQFVKSLGPTGPTSKGISAAGPTMFFVLGTDLWRSDGTADGTLKLRNIGDSSFSLDNAFSTAVLGDRIVFVGADADHGRELWVSDGTVDGTRLLADINPGKTSSISITPLVVADGIAYFTANDGSHGTELWQTDGTSAGTMMVADIEPGSAGSTPYRLTRANDLLYFSATTTANGQELWALPLPKNAAVTTSDVAVKKSDAHATISVRLTRPAPSRISVDYATVDGSAKAGTDYVSKSGTITFEAGDSQKTIEIPLIDDGAVGTTKNFLVHLQNAGASIERSTGAVVIVNDHIRADIGLLPGATNSAPQWTTFNNGPSPASDVRLCYTSTSAGAAVICDDGFEIASAQTHGSYIYGGLRGQTFIGRVLGAEADPNIANNRMTFSTDRGIYPDITIAPAMPQVGKAATVWVSVPVNTTGPYTLTSSDPTILSVPASVTFTANVTVISFNVTPTKPGYVTIRSENDPEPLTVRVIPAAENRLPVEVDATLLTSFVRVGAITKSGFAVGGNTLDGVVPTGTVTVMIDGQLAVVLPLRAAKTTGLADLPSGPAGQTHTVRAVYSGDANFIDGELQWTYSVTVGIPSVTANAVRGLAENVDIIVRGGDGVVPTGTITVTAGSTTYASNAALTPLDAGAAHVVVSGVPASAGTLSVTYSGDANYTYGSFPTAIVGPYGRAVRH